MVQRKLIQSLLVGTGEVRVLQPFVQRQIERSVPSIRLLSLFFFSPQLMFVVFVYFFPSAVLEFIFLLSSTVTFHIGACFPVKDCWGLQRLFCWLLFSLSLFSAPHPTPCSSTHLPCRFIPSPRSAEHRLSFLNQG